MKWMLIPVAWVVWQGIRAMWCAWHLKWDVDKYPEDL